MAKPKENRRNVKSTKSTRSTRGARTKSNSLIAAAVDAAYKKAGVAGQAAAVLVGPTPTPSPDFDK